LISGIFVWFWGKNLYRRDHAQLYFVRLIVSPQAIIEMEASAAAAAEKMR
jgi:hypothetical protein